MCTCTTISVLLSFDRDSCNSMVREESLYGIWLLFDANEAITFPIITSFLPRKVRLEFIFFASANLSPLTFVLEILSDPA